MNKICGNCGKKGHMYKDCNGPITSIGIIAFRRKQTDRIKPDYYKSLLGKDPPDSRNNQVKILLIQRKDTIGYIDFIRGKYDNEVQLIKDLNEMTPCEVERLKTYCFDKLWDDLWADHTCKYYRNDKRNAKYKYEKLNIPYLISQSKQKWVYQEYGLPKGRRNMKEKNRDCAEREFQEETGYESDNYIIIKQLGKIEENFTGTNGVCYKHIYYIAKIKDEAQYPLYDDKNIHQKSELKSIDLFTRTETQDLLRNYDIEKKKIIDIAFTLYEKYEKNSNKKDKFFYHIKTNLLKGIKN
jgi:ADP-ribose pyrophosphatase YjhB (NUDIX family)